MKRVVKAMGLTHEIVGIRFIVLKTEYLQCTATEMKDTTIAELVKLAGEGRFVKADAHSFRELIDAWSLGLVPVPEDTLSARYEYANGTYASFSVAREVFANRQYISQQIYGVELAPVTELDDTDIVISIGTAKDMMRLMQGYARYYGVARNVLTLGCGICNELITKPFMNNDINVSLLSTVDRKVAGFSHDEMGAGFPKHMLESILQGILETVNLTENNGPKKEILARLDDPEELGFPIRMNYDYAIQSLEYRKYCEACIAQEKREEEMTNGR